MAYDGRGAARPGRPARRTGAAERVASPWRWAGAARARGRARGPDRGEGRDDFQTSPCRAEPAEATRGSAPAESRKKAVTGGLSRIRDLRRGRAPRRFLAERTRPARAARDAHGGAGTRRRAIAGLPRPPRRRKAPQAACAPRPALVAGRGEMRRREVAWGLSGRAAWLAVAGVELCATGLSTRAPWPRRGAPSPWAHRGRVRPAGRGPAGAWWGGARAEWGRITGDGGGGGGWDGGGVRARGRAGPGRSGGRHPARSAGVRPGASGTPLLAFRQLDPAGRVWVGSYHVWRRAGLVAC